MALKLGGCFNISVEGAIITEATYSFNRSISIDYRVSKNNVGIFFGHLHIKSTLCKYFILIRENIIFNLQKSRYRFFHSLLQSPVEKFMLFIVLNSTSIRLVL